MWKRWSELASRRAAAVLAVLAVALIGLAILGATTNSELSNGLRSLEDPGSSSAEARRVVEEATAAGPEPELLALISTPDGTESPQARARVDALAQRLSQAPIVSSVLTPADPGREYLRGVDGRFAIVAITLRTAPDHERRAGIEQLQRELGGEEGVRVSGLGALEQTMTSQLEDDLRTAEFVAFPLLFLASLWVFRSVVAATLPLVVGGAGLLATLALVRAANSVVSLSSFVTNLVIMLTLGLAIDYSLFFVNRYREELRRHGDIPAALRTTLRTTGRTMLFSALLVSAAMGSLLVFPVQFVYSMGVAGLIAPLVAVIAALLILPPLLGLLGERVNALTPRWLKRSAERETKVVETGFWYRLAEFVMRRPAKVAIAASLVLLLLGAPAAILKITGFAPEQLPTSMTMRQAHDDLTQAAPSLTSARFYVVVTAPSATRAQLDAYAAQLATTRDVAAVSPPQQLAAHTWRMDVTSTADDLTTEAQRVVADIRSVPAPGQAHVGGLTPAFVDELASLRQWLPYSLLILVAAMLLLLLGFTRSVLLPLKTLLMNLLTLASSVGILVIVFQWLGIGQPPGALSALEVSTLIITVTTAFGLATDYGVFVLGRIAEGHDTGQPDRRAIAVGMERTGRLVSSAALLFAIAVGAFASSQLVFVKELSIGLLVAVLIDATLVRAFLVPALMRLLGSANWWAPHWLRRRSNPELVSTPEDLVRKP